MAKIWKSTKRTNAKTWKCEKCDHDLPLRPENTIPYRGRGTPHKPQNAKMPPPAPTENTKCQKVPFICHFGHFWGFLRMSLFLIIFTLFMFLSLFAFSDFCVLSLFVFFCFSDFRHFFTFWWFYRKHDFSSFLLIFQFLKGYLKDKALFWPLLPTIVHSHGKHLEGVNSLCEIWALFFTHFSWFSLILCHFWSILSDFSILPLRIHFFWLFFDQFLTSIFGVFIYFMNFWPPFLSFGQVLAPPLFAINKCPFGSQKVP